LAPAALAFRELWVRLLQVSLVYICVAGMLSLVVYGHMAFWVALESNDVILALTYVAFISWAIRHRVTLAWPAALIVPLVIFVAIGVAELFNPALENYLVGLVGVRTRLFYIPLLFLAFFYFLTRRQVETFGLLLCVPSIPINLLAVFQYLAGPARVSAWGPGFAASVLTVGMYRPVATFSHPGHYANYLLFVTMMTAACCSGEPESRARWIFRLSLALQCVGIMVAGARLTLLFVPIGIITLWWCSTARACLSKADRWQRLGWSAGIASIGIVVGLFVAPTAASRAMSMVTPSVPRQLNVKDTLLVSARRIASFSDSDLWRGHGLGSASPGSRYVVADRNRFEQFGPAEAAVGQLIWEMGVPGFVAFTAVWLGILGLATLRTARMRDPLLRSVAAAGILFHIFVLSTSGTYAVMDYPPTSVYFWFSLGMLMRLPALDQPALVQASAN
jgi:hypothetical protein